MRLERCDLSFRRSGSQPPTTTTQRMKFTTTRPMA